jgi:Ni/Co efflux regulator RcnB
MLKTISAALLAVSVLAAPAFAATSSQAGPVAKAATAKHRVLNAHARMDHQVSHHRRHRHHHKAAALGKHHISKAAIKHAAPVKRG